MVNNPVQNEKNFLFFNKILMKNAHSVINLKKPKEQKHSGFVELQRKSQVSKAGAILEGVSARLDPLVNNKLIKEMLQHRSHSQIRRVELQKSQYEDQVSNNRALNIGWEKETIGDCSKAGDPTEVGKFTQRKEQLK